MIDGVSLAIQVFVEAKRILAVTLVGIHRPERSRAWVEVSGAIYSIVQNPGTAVFRSHAVQREGDHAAPEPGA
jgi:hypothetical protein